jgi:hypothetical protein
MPPLPWSVCRIHAKILKKACFEDNLIQSRGKSSKDRVLRIISENKEL